MVINLKFFSQQFLGIVFILQVIIYISLFLNFTIVRQVVGIFYLTFIPGLIFIKLAKLDKLSTLETVLFDVGFSIAFIMIAGLALNEFGPAFGLNFPLATLPLSLFLNTLILIGAAAAHLSKNKKVVPSEPSKTFTFSPIILVLALLPLLSIIGTYIVNAGGSNLVLLLMFIAVTITFTVLAFREKPTLEKIYPFAIFMIALALLFQFSLISNYILPYGGDSPVEIFAAKNTLLHAQWYPVLPYQPVDLGIGRINAMLSVTILPATYSNILGMDPTWVFKIINPVIFALVPIALYLIWQPYIGKKFAFLAAFLFMAQSTFYTEMLALNRQLIGELFFVLLLLVILNPKIKLKTKYLSFMVLSLGLIFSHYALAEIFLILITIAWAASTYLYKRPSVNLQFSMIVFFFVAMFLWYIFTSSSIVFNSFLTFIGYVYAQLGDFFNPASRGAEVLTGLGLTQSPSLLNTVSRGFAYITEILIVLGIAAFVSKKTRFQFDKDYTVFSLVAVVFLVSLTVIPGLANTLNMTRFYHILLILLAPFCIIGIWSFVKGVTRKERKLLVVLLAIVVMVPYFLFQTNVVYEVAKSDSWSVPLSGYRMNPLRLYGDNGYIDRYSVYGAEWLYANIPYQNNITADNGLFTALTGYGVIYRGYVDELRADSFLYPGEFLYLSYISIEYQTLYWNNTVPAALNQTNIIYSNGGSEVRCAPSS
jgi:uncharacterized membrane protein